MFCALALFPAMAVAKEFIGKEPRLEIKKGQKVALKAGGALVECKKGASKTTLAKEKNEDIQIPLVLEECTAEVSGAKAPAEVKSKECFLRLRTSEKLNKELQLGWSLKSKNKQCIEIRITAIGCQIRVPPQPLSGQYDRLRYKELGKKPQDYQLHFIENEKGNIIYEGNGACGLKPEKGTEGKITGEFRLTNVRIR